jgi:endonuclease/exonuclease/phosphatase family metal-dependent hydrolase
MLMLKCAKRALLLVSVFFLSLFVKGQELKVATYNIRFDNPRDSGNLWVDRAPVVASLIRFHDFDVFGTQEAFKSQLDDISKALPAYERYGVGRDDGKEKGEHSAIFYKKEVFKLLKKGDFWLSPTPDTPSLGWDAKCCKRICSWVQLQHRRTGKTFYFFNAHYDHEGVQARNESSKLVLQKIKEIADNAPVLFTGDLNGSHTSTWYQEIANSSVLKDTYGEVEFPYAPNGSFNAFNNSRKSTEIIDHIFLSKHFGVKKWGILTDTYNGKFPSDHFPVLSVIAFK